MRPKPRKDYAMTVRETAIRSPRSSKAGRPPEEVTTPARVRRRRKTAQSAVGKDTTLFQAAEGPRVLWGRTKPKIKKR
jgi:hypothetical protein